MADTDSKTMSASQSARSARSIASPRSARDTSSARRSRITVCQRAPRCPFSRRETYATPIPTRSASSCCVRSARIRRSRSARPKARWSRVSSCGCPSIVILAVLRYARTSTIQVPPRRWTGRGRGSERTSSRRVDSLSSIEGLPLSSRAFSRASNKGGTEMSPTADAVPDSLVLAAIERAALHRARDTPDVPTWAIIEHLALPRRARRVRGQLAALEVSGLLVRSRRYGVPSWVLTSAGRRRLQRARRAGTVPVLPESPQHQAWRNARTLAAQEIERFRDGVRGCLDDATGLLRADPPAPSDAWFAVGERLQRHCWRLASATYCLREWAEPDDAHPDIDERLTPAEKRLDRAQRVMLRARRAGRRNTRLWSDERVAVEHN